MSLTHTFDQEADAIYIVLREAPFAYNVVLDGARIVDFAADDEPIGIELLNVSRGVDVRGLPAREAVERVLNDRQVRSFA